MQWKVVLNDSGHPGGKAAVVRLDAFMEATRDYENFAVIVDGHSYRGATQPQPQPQPDVIT